MSFFYQGGYARKTHFHKVSVQNVMCYIVDCNTTDSNTSWKRLYLPIPLSSILRLFDPITHNVLASHLKALASFTILIFLHTYSLTTLCLETLFVLSALLKKIPLERLTTMPMLIKEQKKRRKKNKREHD